MSKVHFLNYVVLLEYKVLYRSLHEVNLSISQS